MKGLVPHVIVASAAASSMQKAVADYYCDGVADDVEIQLALDSLAAAGGNVSLTPGTFFLSSPVKIPSNVSLEGFGFSTKLDASLIDNDSVIINNNFLGGNSYIQIHDLSVINHACPLSGFGSIHCQNTKHLLISNISIQDGQSDGVLLKYTVEYAIIKDIFVKNILRHSIFVGWSCSYIDIRGVISETPGLEHVCLETYAGGPTDWNYYITVSDCIGKDAGNNGYYTEHCKNVVWSNCLAFNTLGNPAFFCVDSYSVQYVNCIARTAPQGFRVLPATWDVSFVNCVAELCVENGYQLEGVRIHLSNSTALTCARPFDIYAIAGGAPMREEIIITGCHFYDQTTFCRVNGTNILISNNVWEESSNKGNSVVIYLYDGANTVKILNNIFGITCTGYGIGNSDGTTPNAEIKGNWGASFETEDSGVATLLSASTTVVVNHKVRRIPQSVIVTPKATWGNMTKFWVNAISSTQFTINADIAPGADKIFSWYAKWRHLL
mgnify:CR=1 FL=1